MASLFPSFRGDATSGSIVQFKAGKCVLTRSGIGKFLVTPTTAKGQISLSKGNDGLIHFKWADRTSGQVADDRIVFPGEITFKKVRTGVESDRVYMLKYVASTAQPLFYWMQDKDNSKDVENVTKLNDGANNPSGGGGNRAGQPSLLGTPSLPFGINFNSLLNFMTPGAPDTPLAQAEPSGDALPPLPPPTTAAATAQVAAAPTATSTTTASSFMTPVAGHAPAAGGLTLADLQRAMSLNQQQQQRQDDSVELQDILTSEAIISSGVLESDPEFRAALLQQCPESQQGDAGALEDNIRSPQFSQALGALSTALQSDNFTGVMSNLGIDPQPGMTRLMQGDGVGAFIDSLQAQQDQVRSSQQASSSSSSSSSSADASVSSSLPPSSEEQSADDNDDTHMQE